MKLQLDHKKNQGYFVATLINVEKPSNPSIRYGKTKSIQCDSTSSFKYLYSDNILEIIWIYKPCGENFYFDLKNNSEHTLKIIWDESSYVDVYGESNKVIHNGIKYIDKEKSQPATSIVKKSSIQDMIIPSSYINYNEYLKDWFSRSLFISKEKDKIDSKIVKILLPIQFKDIINDYIFHFKIEWKYKYPELQ